MFEIISVNDMVLVGVEISHKEVMIMLSCASYGTRESLWSGPNVVCSPFRRTSTHLFGLW